MEDISLRYQQKCAQLGMSFQHCLLRMKTPLRFLQKPHPPPTTGEAALFLESHHPDVLAHFPHIEGWSFEEGESVATWDRMKRGTVRETQDSGVWCNCEDGLQNFGWALMKE